MAVHWYEDCEDINCDYPQWGYARYEVCGHVHADCNSDCECPSEEDCVCSEMVNNKTRYHNTIHGIPDDMLIIEVFGEGAQDDVYSDDSVIYVIDNDGRMLGELYKEVE